MQVSVSIQQSLQAAMRHEVETLDQVTAKVVKAVGGRTKVLLRRDTSAALGQRVANAWRDNFYPNENRGPAKAADLVFTKAPKIVDAFDVGAMLRAKHGRLMAIPTKNVPRDRDGHKSNPASFAEAGIELRFVPPGRFGKYAALVADDARLTGSGRFRHGQVGKRGKMLPGAATLVMFWLIPRAKLPKRLDLATHHRSAEADLFATMTVELRNAP